MNKRLYKKMAHILLTIVSLDKQTNGMETDQLIRRENLVKECERLNTCEFFKVAIEQDSEEVLNEYIKVFCRGPLQEKCYRLDYLKRTGVLPISTISPSGLDYSKYL